jgi:hypothetical protein
VPLDIFYRCDWWRAHLFIYYLFLSSQNHLSQWNCHSCTLISFTRQHVLLSARSLVHGRRGCVEFSLIILVAFPVYRKSYI